MVSEVGQYELLLMPIVVPLSLIEGTVIVFIVADMRRTNSNFLSGYFILYVFSLVLNMLHTWLWICENLVGHDSYNWYVAVIAIEYWYAQYVNGILNLLLGFSQCTALAFPLVYHKFFSGNRVFLIFVLVVLTPFVADGFSWVDTHCRLFMFADECKTFRRQHSLYSTVLNVCLCVFAVLFVLFGVYRSNCIAKSCARLRAQRRLVVQTVCSSITLILCALAFLLANYVTTGDNAAILRAIGASLYCFLCYPSLAALFCVSPLFRRGYAKFYHLTCSCLHRKIHHSTITVFSARKTASIMRPHR